MPRGQDYTAGLFIILRSWERAIRRGLEIGWRMASLTRRARGYNLLFDQLTSRDPHVALNYLIPIPVGEARANACEPSLPDGRRRTWRVL